jgi:SAM-dependent methyltransferase
MIQNDRIWQGAYKIPWDDPDFSRRMLAEHLTQEHDLASRRTVRIDRQVAWIHDQLLNAEPARILDLGCGPGLYSHRLADRGNQCRGIDFGPASIEYAQQQRPNDARCEFMLGDIRQVAFGGPYDLAMFLYGELNVFSPDEVLAIVRKARASLATGGYLVAEVQTPETVRGLGNGQPTEEQAESGLFSDRPYRCRTERRWLSEQQVSIQTFTVTDAASGQASVYRSTTKAWPDDELSQLMREAGFSSLARDTTWPSSNDLFALWVVS